MSAIKLADCAMSLPTLNVTHRIAIAVGAPILALIFFAGLFVMEHRSDAARMRSIAELTEFGRTMSAVIHELQRERGNSAGFVGSRGGREFATRLDQQRARTDLIISQYFSALQEHDPSKYSAEYAQAIDGVNTQLRSLADHRGSVDTLEINLSQAVSPYTAIINGILHAYVQEIHVSDDAGLTEGMISLLNLMEAKENAGIERAVGANTLGSGTVNRNNHRRLTELQAAQEAFLAEFSMIAGPEWSDRVTRAVEPTLEAVQAYRDTMAEGGYGAALPQGEGGAWFDASTRRIDALMDVESEFATYLVDVATVRLEASNRSAWFYAALAVLVTLATIWLSIQVALSVVRPIKMITDNLERIACGETDVRIRGVARQDEIGVLARAARDFLADSEQRRALEAANLAKDQKAMAERTAYMKKMSQEVEAASERSLGRVVGSASDIRERSLAVKASLSDAVEKAESVADRARVSSAQSSDAAEQADQLIYAINEVTEQITRSDGLVRDAVGKASQSSEAVNELRDAAAQIGNFIEIINGLAEQTNLLALNATIEAARAGEAGRGFAVVASEVKALAAQTNKSASEISERVSSIQGRTQDTVTAIDAIASSIDTLSEVTTAVSAAMEEQRASTSSFLGFVEQTRTATSDVVVGVEEIRGVAERVSSEAEAFASTADDMADMSELARFEIPRIVTAASNEAEEEISSIREDRRIEGNDLDGESEDVAHWG